MRYLYLPRLKDRNRSFLEAGAASRDFFGTAYGQKDGTALLLEEATL